MPNPSYRRGRAAEYELKKKLELAGYKVLRTAGSHGDYDLVAYSGNSTPVRLIQVKTTASSQTCNTLVRNSIPVDGIELVCPTQLLVERYPTIQPELWVKFKGKWHSLYKLDGSASVTHEG